MNCCIACKSLPLRTLWKAQEREYWVGHSCLCLFGLLHTDTFIANARTIYGPNRFLDIITYGSSSSRKIAAAVVEHNPIGRSFVHCCSAKEETRLAALEHLLVIQEDIMQRLMDREGITSNGWLPMTAQAQHARNFGSMSDIATSSRVPSKPASPLSSVPSMPQPHRPGHVQWLMGSEG